MSEVEKRIQERAKELRDIDEMFIYGRVSKIRGDTEDYKRLYLNAAKHVERLILEGKIEQHNMYCEACKDNTPCNEYFDLQQQLKEIG